ncbi:MAG: hypothetical protein COV75_01540 [Candidatus Omnitrophica bacterium CG11_big_fil_rev_8_21_14_0_20_63_9]|nr:MAG: hypothetical protein COV75_01540 [Candidatus Omnitrophica bacterium CG11_big_fil_rev_8_21_14_0_20_63_9]
MSAHSTRVRTSLVLSLGLLIPTLAASAQEAPKAAAGQCIVKFKQDGSHALTTSADALVNSRQGRTAYIRGTADRSSSLYDLFAKVNVTAARSVFRSAAETLPAPMALHKSAQQPPGPSLDAYMVLHYAGDRDPEAMCADLKEDLHVESCQPNYQMQAAYVPNDPYYHSSGAWGQPYGDLWGLKLLRMAQAWNVTQGRRQDQTPVLAAVVDTGVDAAHPDLAANVWTNPGEVAGNGVDDDANGYIDDVYGWDFTTCRFFGFAQCLLEKPRGNDTMDHDGHGTHVSGTIAAVGNNGLGIIGVAPQAKILPVKGLNDDGQGYSSDLAAGIVYAAQQGAAVINNSWGCGGPCPSNPVVEDAVRAAMAMGSTVVFAAGNSSDDVAKYSPQNMTDVKPIVVSASSPEDRPAFFTNYGLEVDVAAPGGDDEEGDISTDPFRNILSLRATDCDGCAPFVEIGDAYLRQAGTSMAAPHVTGVAALIRAAHPEFTPDDVRQVLRATASTLQGVANGHPIGAGRVDAARALTVQKVVQVDITSPDADQSVSPFDGPAAIYGTASGAGFRNYQLFFSEGRAPGSWSAVDGPSTAPVTEDVLGMWEIKSLADGVYTLRLRAASKQGFEFEAFQPAVVERYPGRRLTDAPYVQNNPVISGNRIAWFDERTRTRRDIYMCDYDPQTGACPEQRITTDDSVLPGGLAMDGDRIVWSDRGVNGRPDIYLYNLATGHQEKITDDPSDQFAPVISGDLIAWTDSRHGNPDIYLYDLATGRELRVTTHASTQANVAISGNRLAWWDVRRNPRRDVYVCTYDRDAGTCPEQRITPNNAKAGSPVISGDRVVWADRRSSAEENIFVYDLTTKKERRLIAAQGEQSNVALWGDHLVWMDIKDYKTRSIHHYDFRTTIRREMVSFPTGEFGPVVSDEMLVWSDNRFDVAQTGNMEIMVYPFPQRAISGRILDQAGVPVASVPVELLISRTPRESQADPVIATTGPDGVYRVEGLLPGCYKLTPKTTPALRAQGFRSFIDADDPTQPPPYRKTDLSSSQDQLEIDFTARR